MARSIEDTNRLVEAFERSDEWQRILRILEKAKNDHTEICIDNSMSLEDIRFSQGAISAIEAFKSIPMRMFEEDA